MNENAKKNYIIPSDNWEQQPNNDFWNWKINYIIPSDNWEQQQSMQPHRTLKIISYQAITGNNNLD